MKVFIMTYIGSGWMALALLFILANHSSWEARVIGGVHLLVGAGIIKIGSTKRRC